MPPTSCSRRCSRCRTTWKVRRTRRLSATPPSTPRTRRRCTAACWTACRRWGCQCAEGPRRGDLQAGTGRVGRVECSEMRLVCRRGGVQNKTTQQKTMLRNAGCALTMASRRPIETTHTTAATLCYAGGSREPRDRADGGGGRAGAAGGGLPACSSARQAEAEVCVAVLSAVFGLHMVMILFCVPLVCFPFPSSYPIAPVYRPTPSHPPP